MENLKSQIKELAFKELNEANKKFNLFVSAHEGYAVIKEEVEELADEVKSIETALYNLWCDTKDDLSTNTKGIKNLAINAAAEAVQVVAMCEKYEMSLGGE